MARVSAAPAAPPTRSLVGPIGIGLMAGIATGLFLGDRARMFQVAADGFVRLLQMAVLPYITVSIVSSLGMLRPGDLRTLGVRAALVLAGLWTVALGFAFLMPLTFPPAESATFFSTTMLEPPAPFDLVDLYIPSNPFFALANNIVPAVVLFSITVGIALVGVPGKERLLDVLAVVSQALSRAMRFVVRLTPYGIFAIAAATAGTLRVEQVARLQIYLLAYAGLALLLGLWVLPGLVAALTPIRVREIFAATREALLTAVIAGDLFIVLPVLIAACKDLAVRVSRDAEPARAMPDLIVPISYNFPHSGKLLSASFVLFAGWFSDVAIHPADYPRLAGVAVVTLFGSMSAAIPYLLDAFRVPADTFQLFLASGVVNARFGTLVAAMHTVAVALLGTCALTGALRWQPRAVARFAAVTAALTVAVVGGTRLAAGRLLSQPFAGGDVLAAMELADPGAAVVYRDELPAGNAPPAGRRLETIRRRGTLRVGYLPDALPFAFVNGRGQLVGLDIALMHDLASELGVTLEFVAIRRDGPDTLDLLRRGACDLAAGGLAITTGRAASMELSSPYLDETLAFVVPDDERRRFEKWDGLRNAPRLTIAVPDVPYYVDKLRRRLPQAQIRPVRSIESLFRLLTAGADAAALPAERGSAWTLRYPRYAVVVPSPDLIKVPLAMAMPRGEPDFAALVNTWIGLKRSDGTIDELYRYWILGRARAATPPRWSILRDVLHWEE
jgi:Na+/H+-dicarboxylate symporter